MTGGYTMKEKNIRELAKRMGLITVEDMCQYTITQLVVKIANKVNELVDEVWRFETDVQEILKTQNENIQYLLGEGLHLEIENIFDEWLQDGTFDTLINQTALKKVNDRLDETNAQLSTLSNRNDWFYNVSEFGELSQAKYFHNGVWYEDSNHTKESKDMSGIIQTCIDEASKRGVNTVHMKKGTYLIKNTIKIPYWMNVDFELSTLVPTADGTYINNYMILINSNDGESVITSYGGSDYCTIENIIFDNKRQVKDIRGIFQGASGTIQRIRSHMMYNTITRASEYLDFTKIHNIECAVPRGNDFQIIIKNVGDAMEISRCHMWGWDVDGDYGKNHIFVHNSQGGEITNIINGRIHLVSCNAIGLNNIHLEEGGIVLENSSVNIQNVFMHKKDYCTPLIVKNCQTEGGSGYTKNVKVSNFIIFYFDGRYTKGVEYKDCEITNSGVIFNGFYRSIIPKSGDLASGCLVGCNIYNNGNKLNYAQRYPMSMVNSYVNPDGMELGYSTGRKDYMEDGWGLQVWATNQMTSSLESGTYYYTVVYYNDVSRQLGYWDKDHQKSTTLTKGQSAMIEFPEKYSTGRVVRIYRGKTSSTYTHYVDVPVVQGKYLFDTGLDVCGYPWKEKTNFDDFNPNYQQVIIKGTNVECQGTSTPQHGSWVKGDKIINTAIASGNPQGWVYNGTAWVSMAQFS